MADADARVHGPNNDRAGSATTPRGMARIVAAAFAGLRGWLFLGRRYRPERRYMRGGGRHAAQASAER